MLSTQLPMVAYVTLGLSHILWSFDYPAGKEVHVVYSWFTEHQRTLKLPTCCRHSFLHAVTCS